MPSFLPPRLCTLTATCPLYLPARPTVVSVSFRVSLWYPQEKNKTNLINLFHEPAYHPEARRTKGNMQYEIKFTNTSTVWFIIPCEVHASWRATYRRVPKLYHRERTHFMIWDEHRIGNFIVCMRTARGWLRLILRNKENLWDWHLNGRWEWMKRLCWDFQIFV